jgi:hypothetical protein
MIQLSSLSAFLPSPQAGAWRLQLGGYILYNKGYASHTVALPFTLKTIILRQKEKLWKLKYFKAQKYKSF